MGQQYFLSRVCLIVIAAVRITGGVGRYSRTDTRAELFNPQSNKSCPLPPFSPERNDHSSCAGLLCGHWSIRVLQRSCNKINDASITITMRKGRYRHLCWKLPGEQSDVLLLGGFYSGNTTERISGSSSSDNFTLPYLTQ